MKEGPSRPAVRCRSQANASCCRQERWGCCVKKARERNAVREMKEDPSEPSCRGGLQTAMKLLRSKAAVVNVMVKRRDVDHVRYMDERDERKRTSGDASKRFRRYQNWSCTTAPGRVWREPTYWPRGVRCIGGMTLIRALVRNLRTCPTMPREKAQAANLRGRKYRCGGQGRTAL